MAEYKVVVGTLWVDGKKHKRGDVIDLADAGQYGVNVEPYHAPKPKPAPKRRTRKVVHED